MEYYVDLSLTSLSELDLKKSTFSMSEPGDALLDPQPQGVLAWYSRIRADTGRNQDRIVTSIDLYKKRSASFQHEYLVLSVQSRPPPQGSDEPLSVTLVKIERRITDRTLPARLGLWGPAVDQVTVLGLAATVTLRDDRLYHIGWVPNNAPSIYAISYLACLVRFHMPQYFFLRTSCYAFAGATIRAVDIILNGNQGVQQQHSLTCQTYFLGCIPAGATQAESVAADTVVFYRSCGDPYVADTNLEG